MPIVSGGGGAFSGGTITKPLVLAMANSGDVPLQLKPPAGATAAATDQLEVFDDAGNLIGYWDARGNVSAGPAAAATNSSIGLAGKGAGSGTLDAGSASVSAVPNGDSFIQAVTGSRISLRIVGQSRNPLEIGNDGVFIRLNTSPADASLAAGEVGLWLDATNGAGNTKLMAKAKSADGTVRSAIVAVLT